MRFIESFRTTLFVATPFAAFALGLLAPAARGDESKTAEEGMMKARADNVRAQATFIQAQAQLIGAVSQAGKTRAETRKTLEECHTLELDNDKKATTTFYEKRAARETYVASHVRARPSPEDLGRYSKAYVPERMSPYSLTSTGSGIRWPVVFQREEFAACRAQLEVAFAQRSFGDGGVGGVFYRHVNEATRMMRAELRHLIREIPPMEYLAAKRFVDTVAYEAQFPHVLDGVAAR